MVSIIDDLNIQRILIIKWSALGDIAMATCIIEDIALAFPQARIDLNTMPPWDKLFIDDARFTNLLAINIRDKQHPWRVVGQWLRAVRQGHYDLIVDLQSNDRSRLMLAWLQLTGNRTRYLIGNHPGWPYQYSGPLHNAAPNPVERMRAGLRAAGIPVRTPRPVFQIAEHHHLRVRALQQQYGLQSGRYALFYPGCQAAGYLKRWGEDNYAALARRLLDEGRVDKVVLIGSTDEMQDCQHIAALAGTGVVNLCGETDVLDIIPLAQQAALQIGNDTGTAHLAAASAAPMVVVCGPTDAYKVAPQGDNVVTIQAQMSCMNCYCKQPCAHHSCMKAIQPEHVMRALGGQQGNVVILTAHRGVQGTFPTG